MAKQKKSDNEYDPREEASRLTPQNIYDQREARQVGGTVINEPFNRDEYKVDNDAIAERRDDGSSQEDHNFNEVDPDSNQFRAHDDDEDDNAKDDDDK